MKHDFFKALDEIQGVLSTEMNTADKLQALSPYLTDDELSREFFKRLTKVDLIQPLREGGYFAKPPDAENTSHGGVRYPPWPASKYLARMAKCAPNEVAEILAGIETDNPSIISDILDAALAMPTDIAKHLVPVIRRAFKSQLLWLPNSDANNLCVHLASEGEFDAAIQIADAMFVPRVNDDKRTRTRPNEGLAKLVPLLASRHGRQFVPRLCDWLKAWVELKKHVDPESGADFSYSWRPAIEDHEQNKHHDFTSEMVGFVREGFEKAIEHQQLTLDNALAILDDYPYLVFKRLRLHLINTFSEQNPRLARQTMMSHKLFDDYEYKHEYAMLVGHRLQMLTEEERKTWFGWIKAGPDMSDYDEWYRERFNQEPTEKDRRDRLEYWQFEKLHWVRDFLEGEWKNFYERMLASKGDPKLADLNVYSEEGKWGHDSPMEVSELDALSFKQAVEKVVSWQPAEPGQFRGPSIEGLASTFRQYVATNPEKFSKEACVLEGRPAIYVRGFLDQMTQAAKDGKEIDLAAVMKLCDWVVQRPVHERTIAEDKNRSMVDPDWQWTRDQISSFAQAVCEARKNDAPRYPLERTRNEVWKLIEPLLQDRTKSYIVRKVEEEDLRVHDYLDLGINSPRGKAVAAALEYARWIAIHSKERKEKTAGTPEGFDVMPEIRDMLEWQIDAQNSSVEVMSIIGSRIGLINWIDKKWLAEHAASIFDLERYECEPHEAHGWSAWNSFLVWCKPHIEFYQLFRKPFAYAVTQAARVNLPERSDRQPMEHLGVHLMILYGRGQLTLDDDNGLLRQFLDKAVPEIRRHAIEFVGRSLKREDKLEKEVIERFMTLWDEYWSGQGREDAEQASNGMLFGTWFASGQFPDEWSLEQLEEFVKVVPTPEPEHQVAERLAAIAHVEIATAIRILGRVVRGSNEDWHLHYWQKPAKKILAIALKSNQEVNKMARSIIDYLGRRGYLDFGELLKS